MDAIIGGMLQAFGPSVLVLAVALLVMKLLLDSRIKRLEFAHAEEVKQRLQIDQHLRERREAVYKLVWDITRQLPAYPPDADASRMVLKTLNEQLRDWYFDGGGMYLSEPAAFAYRNLQQGLLAQWAGKDLDEKLLRAGADDYEPARRLCSAFRTELTRDLLSRQVQYFAPPAP